MVMSVGFDNLKFFGQFLWLLFVTEVAISPLSQMDMFGPFLVASF
jgi:hypothetical protein